MNNINSLNNYIDNLSNQSSLVDSWVNKIKLKDSNIPITWTANKWPDYFIQTITINPIIPVVNTSFTITVNLTKIGKIKNAWARNFSTGTKTSIITSNPAFGSSSKVWTFTISSGLNAGSYIIDVWDGIDNKYPGIASSTLFYISYKINSFQINNSARIIFYKEYLNNITMTFSSALTTTNFIATLINSDTGDKYILSPNSIQTSTTLKFDPITEILNTGTWVLDSVYDENNNICDISSIVYDFICFWAYPLEMYNFGKFNYDGTALTKFSGPGNVWTLPINNNNVYFYGPIMQPITGNPNVKGISQPYAFTFKLTSVKGSEIVGAWGLAFSAGPLINLATNSEVTDGYSTSTLTKWPVNANYVTSDSRSAYIFTNTYCFYYRSDGNIYHNLDNNLVSMKLSSVSGADWKYSPVLNSNLFFMQYNNRVYFTSRQISSNLLFQSISDIFSNVENPPSGTNSYVYNKSLTSIGSPLFDHIYLVSFNAPADSLLFTNDWMFSLIPCLK